MVTTNEPDVTVTDVLMIKTRTYGNAGKIALIGAFPISTFLIDSFTKVEDAKSALLATGTTVPDDCISYGCLDYIFSQGVQSKGPEEVIIVNTNYGASSLSYTIDNLLTTLDKNTKLLEITNTLNPSSFNLLIILINFF